MINLAKFILIILLQFEQNESTSSSVIRKLMSVMTSFIFTIIVKAILDWFGFRKIINEKFSPDSCTQQVVFYLAD